MSYTLKAVAVMGAALIVSGRANAQVVTQHNLSLAMAKTIAEATLAECKAKGAHSSAVVVDRAGQASAVVAAGRRRGHHSALVVAHRPVTAGCPVHRYPAARCPGPASGSPVCPAA